MMSDVEIIGAVAGAGAVSVMGGVWLSRRWASHANEIGDAETVPAHKVLRTGLATQFPSEDWRGSLSLRGNWTGHITRVEKSTLTLAVEWESEFPVPQHGLPVLKSGQSVLLQVTGDKCLYRFAVNLRDVREAGEHGSKRLLVVSFPPTVTQVQRRRFPRHSLSIPATVTHAEHYADVPHHGTVVDISAGGLRMELGKVLTVSEAAHLVETYHSGTLLRIRLPLPTLPHQGLLGRVCSCERTAQRGGLGVRIACEFLPMPEWDAELCLTHLLGSLGERR